MKITRNRRDTSNPLDAGTMSDLAFLLIIYFIVIAGFNVNQGFLLNLPGKDSIKLVFKEDVMQIRLDSQGGLELAGQAYQFEELGALISQTTKSQPNLTVLLQVHPEASWQFVVNFLDLVNKRGIDNFSFVLDKTVSSGLGS